MKCHGHLKWVGRKCPLPSEGKYNQELTIKNTAPDFNI